MPAPTATIVFYSDEILVCLHAESYIAFLRISGVSKDWQDDKVFYYMWYCLLINFQVGAQLLNEINYFDRTFA